MYIRPCYRDKNGKRHAYWALVESVRTSRGPRQRVVAYVGLLEERRRLGVKQAAEKRQDRQRQLFDDVEPEYVEIDSKRIRVTRCRDFGGPWLGTELIKQLGLDRFFRETVFNGREQIPWAAMSEVLVLSRLCHPSSELHIAEHDYRHSALEDVLGIPSGRINEDRLYRAMDNLLPHKEALESFLKEKMGTLFDLDYDLVLYDVTSTYFEGESGGGSLGKRGYSRDHRPDCRQVCIGLVVSRCGIPLGYELFAGNRSDVTTLEEIVQKMEKRYGKAGRIWVLDRGMISEENIEFLKEGKRRYIVGTPRGMLKKFERDLLGEDWQSIREGLEVKLCPSPDGQESFILCRSRDRTEKEKAMHERFEKRIEAGLEKISESCRKRKCRPGPIDRRVGKLLGRNSRAAGLFQVHVTGSDKSGAKIRWEKIEAWREWANLSEGCYLLRSNVTDWNAEELWKAYMQLTEAEAAFRIQKSDLQIRPIWHQKEDRVRAHILVCFLAYVLWKTLGQLCMRAGLGNEPRKVFDEIGRIRVVDVVAPTRSGVEIRKRCVTEPTDHQAVLLDRLGLSLPSQLQITQM